MVKLCEYKRPADDLSTDKQREVVSEIRWLLDQNATSHVTEDVLRRTAEQIIEADDGLSGDDPDVELSPDEAAEQMAEDAADEFDLETTSIGRMVVVELDEKYDVERQLYGYADTTASDNGLDFTTSRREGHNIHGADTTIIEYEFY